MILRAPVACALGAFACIYRFNTMGGSFGGFDNDHFVHFAYAKQLQAGERPLIDFVDVLLQGAWPPLTLGVSALGQQWLGDNLRSEAIVTIGAIGLAVALTFLAASALTRIGWALAATLVSVFVAPTLYNYPKVLVLAAVSVLIVLYAKRPTAARVVGAAGLTAVAFLFRHDLAVYAGIGILTVFAWTGDRRRAVRHTSWYVALTLVLLTPSLLYVQRHYGLATYMREGLAGC